MGGKQKQAQRVKNNARPSNSGRSADFLCTSMPPFNFNTMKESGFSATAFSMKPIDDIDTSVDANFQLVLKKMNKKDATTKLKALQEFNELVKNSDVEAVKAILPFWPRLYCALATDAEHKVREATHLAHNQVVLKTKRNLAPYLKQLAGPWFTSQYDTYAPSSSAATAAFKNAFPVNKVQEAIVFCQEEILNYIYDNLIVHTMQTLSNPASTADESKAKYERVLISSLQGYSLYIQQVSEENIRRVEELNRKIISNKKFWKLARFDLPQIRASWYAVLAVLCEKATFLLKDEETNIVKAVFGDLDETDPAVQFHLWESVLLTMKTIKNWWDYYNVVDKVYPKLWKILQQAGNGNASVIYPNLLILISHLPSTLNDKEFLLKFFKNMKTGLNQTSARTSQIESRAITSCFIECLQYSIMKNHEDAELCQQLLKDHLILLIDSNLIDSKAPHKALFNQISSLIHYWHKNKNANYPNYAIYLTLFWHELESLFLTRINEYSAGECADVVYAFSSRQIDLLVCLKHSVKVKQLTVKFSTEEDANKCPERRSSNTFVNVDQSYLDALHFFVYNISEFYIKRLNDGWAQKFPALIENIVTLVQEFESEDFIRHLKQKLCVMEEKEVDEQLNLMILFDMILNWINHQLHCRRSVVDLIFILLKYASEKEIQQVLNQLIAMENKEAMGWCITRALQHPHNTEKNIQAWLGNEKIGEFLVTITVYEIEDRSTSDLSLLLKQAFTETTNGELFIAKSAIDKILKLLSNCLLHPENHTQTIDNCASLASYIASSIYIESSFYNDELFLALFSLTCLMKPSDDCDYFSNDTLWEVKTAWQDALTSIATNMNNSTLDDLTEKCANILEQHLFDKMDNVDNICDIIIKYILTVERCKPLYAGKIIKRFFERESTNLWKTYIYTLSNQIQYFKGNLCLPSNEIHLVEDKMILKYFIWKLLFCKTILSEIPNDDESDDDVNEVDKNHIIKLLDDQDKYLLELLQDLVVLDNIIDNCTQQKYYTNLQELHKSFTEGIYKLYNDLGYMMDKSLDKALTLNKKWAIPAYKYYVQIRKQSAAGVYRRLLLAIGDQYETRVHLTQAFCKNKEITYDDVEQRMKSSEAIVTLRCLLHCDELDVQIAEVFGFIEILKKDASFYDLNFNNSNGIQIVIEISRLCSQMLRLKKGTDITKRYWDFIVISLGSWSEKLNAAKHLYNNLQIATFISAIGNLFEAVNDYIDDLRIASPNHSWVDEWENVFVQSILSQFVTTWLYIAERYNEMKTVSMCQQLFLQDFGNVIKHIKAQYVFDCRILDMPKWTKLLKQCCILLTSKEHVLQLWGYHMLKVLSIGLIQVDAIAVDTNTPHEKGLIFEQFKDLLVETHNIVSTMLLDFKLGEDSCRVEPFTDSYTYTFAYLLLWDVLLHLCEKSSTELRYQYSDWLRKEDLLSSLLSSIFKLMPLDAFDSTAAKSSLTRWFIEKSTLSLIEPITCEKIERLNCSVYTSTLAQLPATVRQWWSNAEPRTSQMVERVTATYVSPHLCIQEMIDVTQHENKFKNLIIKVHTSVREVVATYTVDDAQMELIVTLPSNYPLWGPDVQCNRQIGGLPHKQWLMQLRMCVLHQNGRIWDALSLWNNNLDKKFDGVEECYICFAVLHPGTYQLPKLSCKTCKKKFHAACLYKWFSTSNKSTCPICRNLF